MQVVDRLTEQPTILAVIIGGYGVCELETESHSIRHDALRSILKLEIWVHDLPVSLLLLLPFPIVQRTLAIFEALSVHNRSRYTMISLLLRLKER